MHIIALNGVKCFQSKSSSGEFGISLGELGYSPEYSFWFALSFATRISTLKTPNQKFLTWAIDPDSSK